MSFERYSKGYFDPRTLYQIDSLYAWKNGLYFPPVVVEINPTSACNQKCRYCYVAGRTSGTMDDALLLKLMSQLSHAGVKAVVFQGAGEPLLQKALPDSIEIGAKKGLAMSLTTNGILLNKEMQERILKHLTYVKFSNLDKNTQRYAYDHGCPEKQWESLIDNIKNAVATREEHDLQILFLATVYLTKKSFHDAYNILKYLKELGIDYVSIQEAVPNEYSYSGKEPLASSYFTEYEINDMKKKVLTLKDEDFFVKVRFPLTDSTFTNGRFADCWVNNWCQGIKFNTVIDTDGEVYPCFRYWGEKEFSYGNLHEKSFEDIWKGEKRKEIEEYTNKTPPKGDECSTCNVTKINDILHNIRDAEKRRWRDFLI